MRLSDVVKAPLWVAELFTTAKSFSANPIIGSQTLNRLGLHVARVRLADWMTRWRRLFLGRRLPIDFRRKFCVDGYVAIENFLTPEDFAAVRAEIVAFAGDLRRMDQGDTETFQGLLDHDTVSSMPAAPARSTS